MSNLKYTVIKNENQYKTYCDSLEELVFQEDDNLMDEIELLTLLIENWDEQNNLFTTLNPVELIKNLLAENGLKPKDLVQILGLSKGTVSKILNYQKGLSKETIRIIASHFKISQEALNKPYALKSAHNTLVRIEKSPLNIR